jgi:hypothetical protein
MVTDSIRYEAQPIPPREPDQGTRWSAILGSIAVIAVLLGGIAFGATLFRGSDDPQAEADPTVTTAGFRTTTTLGSPLANRDQRAEGRFGFGAGDVASRPYYPDRQAGPPTPPLPTQEFTWQKVTLDLPGSSEAYLQGVYPVDDGFIAIGIRSPEGGAQELVVWKSADGTAWTRSEVTGDFTDAGVWNVVFTDYGAIAFGEEWDGRVEPGDLAFREYAPAVRVVWTSPDGLAWTRATLDLRSADNQEVWINTGTVGPDGYIIAGQRSTSPEFQPMIIEKDGYRLELSEYSYTYRVLDAAGTVLVEGSMDDIYGGTYADDGQAVVDPDTGEVYTIVPFETWEQAWADAYERSGDGPLGNFGYTPTVVTIEHDGYRIVVDEELSTYRLEVVATDEVLFSGSADYLWRGPAPVITDAAGNELVSFTWEEFDTAQEAFWNSQGFEEYDYSSEVVVATSTDGITWTNGTVEPDTDGVSFELVVASDDGYFAFGSWYDGYRGGSATWTSADGRQWQRSGDLVDGRYLWNIQQTADGAFIALSDGPQGQTVLRSPDGLSWSEAFGTRIPEDPSVYEGFNQVGTGALGTVIVGSRDHYYGEDYYSSNPLTLTQDDYTLTFDDYDWPPSVTVVDDITGDVVIDVRLREEGGLPEGFTYDDGVTYIENNGIVLMAITDDEWYAAQDERWMTLEENYEYLPSESTMYFSTDLETWTEVPIDFAGWFGHIAVGAEAVVLAGEEYYEEPRLLDPETEYGEGYIYEPPAPVLYIGRP